MIDFSKYAEYLDSYTEGREKLIALSRVVLTLSKKNIFSIQSESNSMVSQDELQNSFEKLAEFVKKHPEFVSEGSYSEACQEYVEAQVFKTIIAGDEFPSAQTLGVSVTDYLLGVCDVTGEMVRKAVQYAINGHREKVDQLVIIGDQIYAQLLDMTFRNGLLRKKFDGVKYNIQKLHTIQYDLVVKKNDS